MEREGPLIQGRSNGRRVRRWTSWYDSRLVTAEGEAILSIYDSWAITFFRQTKIIWSSWGPMEALELPDHEWNPELQIGVRKLQGIDGDRLRLFFLSLLWRAAATTLHEFNMVSLPQEELDQLRVMVLNGDVEPYHFYPIMLLQISTRSFPHNRAAGQLVKHELTIDPVTGLLSNETGREIRFYRFFFDGLVAHMHINDDAEHVAAMGSAVVGGGNELYIPTRPSEQSREMQLLWNEMGIDEPPSSLTRRSHLF
jgi:hypothetical protein